MAALGLRPEMNSDAIIETDSGYIDLRFKCEKGPVRILYLNKTYCIYD